MQELLFFRDFRRFQGGHLNVWHYFQHAHGSQQFRPEVFFTPESVWDETNPWLAMRGSVRKEWNWRTAGALFLGGPDWEALPEGDRALERLPILNLIQHVRHADPSGSLYQFLSRKAIRLCISEEVATAIRATSRVNGPIYTIPNGIDLEERNTVDETVRDIPLLIVGIKNPFLANELGRVLADLNPVVLTDQIVRGEFLSLLQRSKVTLCIPNPTEGFYLPALEGMAHGTVVVCPDCVGNRSFCLDEVTCFRPAFAPEAMAEAVRRASMMADTSRQEMLKHATDKVLQHGIAAERASFLSILDNVSAIWADA